MMLSFFKSVQNKHQRKFLWQFLLIFALMVCLFSCAFHFFMALEGRSYSWVTAVYWTLVVMSTLGFGDITFQSEAGQLFSIFVLLSGTVYMLMLLPFVLIRYIYLPWFQSTSASRVPRKVPPEKSQHVILTGTSPLELSLLQHLKSSETPYVLVLPELEQALTYHDAGYQTLLGALDDPETYQLAGIQQAALLVVAHSDPLNTNMAFTAREHNTKVKIVAIAHTNHGADILKRVGCNHVLQMGQILGQHLARRIICRDGKSHIIGAFGKLRIAEKALTKTAFIGQTLREIRLQKYANVNVIGVWERGGFQFAGPETCIQENTVLMLAGEQEQLQQFDSQISAVPSEPDHVLIIGGGRVGRAIANTLKQLEIAYCIVEKRSQRIQGEEHLIQGDAAALDVLEEAGLQHASCVVLTTHDDDINIYLTLYCRHLRPEILILARANLDRNLPTLYRAGADFVTSYAALGASLIFNTLKKRDPIFSLIEGVDAFRIPVPSSLIGSSLAKAQIRQLTGCNVVALMQQEHIEVNPSVSVPLPAEAELIIFGDLAAEHQFRQSFGS